MTCQNHRISPTHKAVKRRPLGWLFDSRFCDLILLKYFSAQTLGRTEIEWNDVKANSVFIMAFWKCWINHFVTSSLKIPDFSFHITLNIFIVKNNFNHKSKLTGYKPFHQWSWFHCSMWLIHVSIVHSPVFPFVATSCLWILRRYRRYNRHQWYRLLLMSMQLSTDK